MSSTKKTTNLPPLRTVLEEAAPPYTDAALRLLFCTTLQAGNCRYRIRELEFYAANDPYTHQGDEQVSSTGGWYFHRTKPGGGWKGGTFMGVDISFAPIGTAGGILIRGLSRCHEDDDDEAEEFGKYFDGSCNCVRELLRACGVSKIKELVDKPNFNWDALTEDGILRLEEHAPLSINPKVTSIMEWKAASRVGLSEPAKKKDQLEERKKYHLKPFRFLSAPYETKKEKTKIKSSTTGGNFSGVFPLQSLKGSSDEDTADSIVPTKKTKKQVLASLVKDKKNESANGSDLVDTDEDEFIDKSALFGDSDSDSDDDDDDDNAIPKANNPWSNKSNSNNSNTAIWHYWLDAGMDGKQRGWHLYDKSASAKLEGFIQNKGEQLSRTTWHLQSGYFSYEVDISSMTQRNMKTGTVRPIRRVLPNEVFSMTEPPIYVPPKNSSKKATSPISSTKKHKASWSSTISKNENSSNKKQKTGQEHNEGDEKGLKLEPLFAGKHGYAWEGTLTKVLEQQPQAAAFIGPNRNKEIHPVREMTFRALMALPPEENNIIIFGQAPYPRVESASGIAMFDSLIQSWECAQFGKTVSMRCIAKAAAVAKGIVTQDAKVTDLRTAFGKHDIVSPPEWFQAMLVQGVLLLNASLTIGAPFSTAQHTKFWMPVMRAIVEKILQTKRDKFPPGAPKRRIAFLWWGNESLKTKKALAPVLAAFEKDIEISHIQHYNPAAQGDKFVQPPNHFEAVNVSLAKGNLAPIDWLPNKEWLKEHHCDEHAEFITETQELHKLYLDRIQAGLDLTELAPIVGILASELCSLPDACDAIGLRSAAESAVNSVQSTSSSGLSSDEKGAVYLYTTNVLYRRLNEALRHPNRDKVKVYFEYLRVFLEAYGKMKPVPRLLYRGIYKDLTCQYKWGSNVTWWTVSSCTPNIDVAKAFGGGSANGTLFHVETKTAVPIMHLSAYKSEEEYVLAPGTVLKVVKIEKNPNEAVQIYLEEVEGSRCVS